MADGMKKSGVELVVSGLSAFVNAMSQAAKSFGSVGKAAEAQARSIVQASAAVDKAQQRMIEAQRNVLKWQERQAAASKTQAQALQEYTEAENLTLSVVKAAANETAKYNVITIEMIEAMRKATGATGEYQSALGALDQANAAASGGTSLLTDALFIATGATDGLGIAIFLAGEAFGALRGAMGLVVNVVSAVTRAFGSLLSAVKSVADKILDFFRSVTRIASGILLADVIRNIGAEMRQLSTETVTAIADFQKLAIQFNTLAARDIAEEQMIPFASAMKLASGSAESLLNWVKQIAVTTPFTVKDISTTLALARAYGITTGASKTLISATTDFASAMGLTSDHVYRIVYNMGQMVSQGKITGREMRDLAISFFPVQQILEELAPQFNKTKEEMYNFALEGGVPLQTFLNAFVTIAQRDFPDAAKAMSHTLTGVINNLKDFFQVIVGTEVLGPTFNRITEIMANALDNLLTPAVRRTASLLGDTLLRTFNTVWGVIQQHFIPAIMNLAKALGLIPESVQSVQLSILKFGQAVRIGVVYVSSLINALAEKISGRFNKLAANGESWGYNLIVSFAKGMAQALTLVVNVLIALGNIIASLLKAFSPPKLLPDLPKWGMAAMRSYLEGFLMVDFDILKGIQSPLKSALDILEETGQIGENMAGKLLARFSKTFAQALATGKGFAQVFEQLASIGGQWGGDLVELAKRYLTLRDALKELTKQEELLTAARQAETAAEEAQKRAQDTEQSVRVKLNDQIRAYNNLVRKGGADKAVLKNKLAEINATQKAAIAATEQRKKADEAVEIARAQVEAQQALVQAAQDYADKMQEAVDIQKELIDQLLSLTKEQIIQVKVETAGGGAGAETPEVPDIGAGISFPEIGETVGEKSKAAIRDAEIAMRELESAARIQMQKLADDISAPFDELTRAGGKLDQLQEAWEPVTSRLDQIDWDKVSSGVESFGNAIAAIDFSGLTGAIESFSGWVLVFQDTGFWGGIGALFSETIQKKILDPIGGLWNDFWAGIFKNLTQWFVDMAGGSSGGMQSIGGTISENLASIWESWQGAWNEIKTFLGTKWDEMWTAVQGAVIKMETHIKTKMDAIRYDWGQKWDEIKTKIGAVWNDPDGIVQKVVQGVADLWTTIKDGPKALWTLLVDFKNTVLDSVASGFNSIVSAIGNVITWLGELWNKLTSPKAKEAKDALDDFKEGSPPPLETGFKRVGEAVRNFAMKDLDILMKQMDMLAETRQTMFNAQMSMAPLAQNVSSRTVNLNVPYQKGGGMDLAVFRAIIRDEVRHAILD